MVDVYLSYTSGLGLPLNSEPHNRSLDEDDAWSNPLTNSSPATNSPEVITIMIDGSDVVQETKTFF